jgi:hypothetical protein
MKRLKKLWVGPAMVSLFLLFVFLAACNGAAEEEAAEDLEPHVHLHNTAWLVTAYENSEGELADVLEDTEITANA